MRFAISLLITMIAANCCWSVEPQRLKVATFNASLYRQKSGELLRDLEAGKCKEAQALAAILQRLRPDIVLVNEVDYEAEGKVPRALLAKYLAVSQDGDEPIEFSHFFHAEVNTGVPSKLDIDGDGKNDGPADCWGFGRYPGQYGMLVLSRFPIDTKAVRTFRNFLWSAMPGAQRPTWPETGKNFYDDGTWTKLRLSSKSHWDVPIQVAGRTVHLLASHPTPPAFDGPADHNGCRNHDEVRLWLDYLTPSSSDYLVDDNGQQGGLSASETFVIVGDLNSDPVDGNSRHEAIRRLLAHPRLQDPKPKSVQAATVEGRNKGQSGDPATDTAHFEFGNVRVDYVLPSVQLRLVNSGVFWPKTDEPGAKWVDASDHRLVWVEVELPGDATSGK